jgi:hypothetical protein
MTFNLFVVAALLFGPAETGQYSRVRTMDQKTAMLIALGQERSVTLRGLIAEIEAGDVIVHVDRDNFMPGRLTGRMRLTGRAGNRRYVRISIDAELQAKHFIAALAHELQHVSELVAHPEVDDESTLESLYQRIGREYRVRGLPAFETDAARRVSIQVHRELSARPPHFAREITITAQSVKGAR